MEQNNNEIMQEEKKGKYHKLKLIMSFLGRIFDFLSRLSNFIITFPIYIVLLLIIMFLRMLVSIGEVVARILASIALFGAIAWTVIAYLSNDIDIKSKDTILRLGSMYLVAFAIPFIPLIAHKILDGLEFLIEKI